MSLFRNFGLDATLAIALSLPLLSTPSHAYTQEEQQACQPDAFRLCNSEIPDVDRVTACMIARKAQLSPQCRQFFRAGPEGDEAAARPVAAGRPMSIKPATKHKAKENTKANTKATTKTKTKPKEKTAKPHAT